MPRQNNLKNYENTRFTHDRRPNEANRKKGFDIAMQKQRLRKNLTMVLTQSLTGVKDNAKINEIVAKVKEFFPDIPEEEINYGIGAFVNCFIKIQETKNIKHLKTALEIAGVVDANPKVEINTTIEAKPKVWDIEELKKIRKALFDK